MNWTDRLAQVAHGVLWKRTKERQERDPQAGYFLPTWTGGPEIMREDFRLMGQEVVRELATGYHIGDVQQRAMIFDRIAAWSKQTFPCSTLQSTFEHLKREMNELEKDPANPGEQADIIHLIVQLAHLSGHDLMTEVEKKFAENQARVWQEPDAAGVVEHVRERRG